jgi:Chondroitinase B
MDTMINCYPATGLTNVTINPATMAELAAEVGAAPAGRHLLIPDGTYPGETLNFNASGTEANPIVIRPEGARGSVIINDADWQISGSRLVIKDIFFNNPAIGISGQNHRITRCQFRRVERRCVQIHAATNTRVDHCDWSDAASTRVAKNFVWLNHKAAHRGSLRKVLVDHNYCHDSNPTQGVNGSDFIGFSASAAAGDTPGLIIHRNLFKNISFPGDGELVGAKTSGIKFRFNTCLNMRQPHINAPRMGAQFEARSNWFEGCASNILQIRGDDGVAVGNVMRGDIDLIVGAGDFYWAGVTGRGYPAGRRCRLIGNRLQNGHVLVGTNDRVQPALRTNLHNNVREAGGDPWTLGANHTNTTFDADPEDYEEAVKLTTAQVGMGAADPLCPSGPQN